MSTIAVLSPFAFPNGEQLTHFRATIVRLPSALVLLIGRSITFTLAKDRLTNNQTRYYKEGTGYETGAEGVTPTGIQHRPSVRFRFRSFPSSELGLLPLAFETAAAGGAGIFLFKSTNASLVGKADACERSTVDMT